MPENVDAQITGPNDTLLRLIADTAPAMLAYFDARTLRCRFANINYARNFGLTPAEAIGKTVREIVGEAVWQLIAEHVERGLRGEHVRYEREVPQPDGPPRHIESLLMPHFEHGQLQGAVVQITDVSHHHHVAQKVRDSEERMRKFTEVTTEAIVMHRDGLIIDGNEALSRLAGYTLDELTGRPILDYICPEFRLYALQYMRSGREDRFDGAIQHKDGHRIPVEIEAKTMPAEGEPYRIVLVRDITLRQLAQERMDFLAQHDQLTQLPNRVRLIQMLRQALSLASVKRRALAVLIIDLDHFKTINDSLGHQAGDLLLCEVAQRLRGSVRAHDLVARVGGDEFVVVLTDDPDPQETETQASHLQRIIEAPCAIDGTPLVISPCMGIAMYPGDGKNAEELLNRAESAMHMAKDSGRRNLQFYAPAQDGQATQAQMLMQEQQLRGALERGEFELYYQPQTFTADGRLAGFEALVRWRHPQRGLVLPGEFIGFAEARGLISAIDHWVLREACRQARQWQDEGLAPVPLSVNLSALEFRQRDMAREVAQVLEETGLEARWLHIELTESTLMHTSGQVQDTLQALQALGVGLAIDDFGTGYSSLAYLRRHPINQLKIDRSFIADVPDSEDDTAIVTAIVQMGHSLHLDIVAEGVETPAQLALLRELGCGMMQGYLVAPPLPAERARAWQLHNSHPVQRQ
ncbi:diguanylate cyclase/phosphodiesterase with PAS/PAC sensor(s) [Delftia acidovorans SPH-1]|uniref:Diguanylate cyclase/phosphodiesterase with PAS/PAC sensor(S) n=5 Tax=Delftia acidovorans TaxID=80866 RepID=A9BUE4_DELAS|nr:MULTISPECIES: EAL domain-containing protein [Delftia]MBA4003430.1 GGDEF domain-containing protein [Delftia sp.]ABX33847.1 diguanylate cyclase/phosphodiesterase with PAS/PAC sensor(s) [Delftia acidovorans SPH-1]MCP4018616.1 EAL domain-containing protein [Delftia sp.]MCP4514326.1 EAL domain-containing protein [Delftia sp.]MCP4530482.1 EAL domain-containing protein [Delftia sp.]